MPATPLDLSQLRTFYVLAQAQSFTRAADRLGRTQSAVSHAIRKLEESSGVVLVDRRGRGFRLTDEGQHLFEACETVFTTLEVAGEELREGRARAMGRLRFGAPVEFGCSVLMRHISSFIRDNPGIDLDFTLSHDLLTPLLRDDIDVAIDCVEHFQPELQKVPLFREAYMVACSPEFRRHHRLREPADLANVPVLSMDKLATWWHRLLRAVPEDRRPELRRVMLTNHVRAMINAAVEGLGVALVPSYTIVAEVERGALVQLFPSIQIQEDRFRIYQKRAKATIEKHRRLLAYLQSIHPSEFGL